MSRRNIPEEFKAEAVQLVVSRGYSFTQACEAMGVGDTALRRWVAQWRAEQAKPPRTTLEIEADARRIRELEARVADLERERDILKNRPTRLRAPLMSRNSRGVHSMHAETVAVSFLEV
ncbi:transposase [Paraburkholderia sp. GAS32]|jgi:transposase